MNTNVNREIHLKSRPSGLPTSDNFTLATTTIPTPEDNQVLVRNIYMSVDPYMRGRMVDRRSYTPPFQLGEPLTGGCVGQVVASELDQLQVGDYVLSMFGWREYFVASPDQLTKIDPTIAPLSAYVGTVGMPGQTAYVGLLDIGQPKAGETVFVSAASGGGGSHCLSDCQNQGLSGGGECGVGGKGSLVAGGSRG